MALGKINDLGSHPDSSFNPIPVGLSTVAAQVRGASAITTLLIFRARDWPWHPALVSPFFGAITGGRASRSNRGKLEMTDSGDAIVRELKDRQDILDCLVRYCRGVDRLDREILRSAYHDGAVDDHGDYVGDVEGFIEWAFDYHITHQLRTVHAITNHTCELAGDTAHTETYWTFTALNRKAPHHARATGRYIDRLEKRNGRWAIAARICVLTALDNGSDPLGLVGDIAFVASHRDRTDPSYMRPLMVDPARFTRKA